MLEPVLSSLSYSPGFRLNPSKVWIPCQVDTAALLSHLGLSSEGFLQLSHTDGTLILERHWEAHKLSQQRRQSYQPKRSSKWLPLRITVFKIFSWYCVILSFMKNKRDRTTSRSSNTPHFSWLGSLPSFPSTRLLNASGSLWGTGLVWL